MKRFYLIFAIIGAVIPYIFFTQYIMSHGLDIVGFVVSLFVNPVVAGFTLDVLLASLLFWIVIFIEYRKGNGPNPFIFILLNCLIGLACALGAYLYAKETKAGK